MWSSWYYATQIFSSVSFNFLVFFFIFHHIQLCFSPISQIETDNFLFIWCPFICSFWVIFQFSFWKHTPFRVCLEYYNFFCSIFPFCCCNRWFVLLFLFCLLSSTFFIYFDFKWNRLANKDDFGCICNKHLCAQTNKEKKIEKEIG